MSNSFRSARQLLKLAKQKSYIAKTLPNVTYVIALDSQKTVQTPKLVLTIEAITSL